MSSRQAGIVVLSAAAAVLNVNFMLERLLAHPTPISVTVVSDLAVPGREWSWVFRLADAASAVLLLVLCALVLGERRHCADVGGPRSSRLWRPAAVALAVFAASTLTAVFVPEHCAASSDPSCAATLGGASLADVVHDVVSTVGTASGLAAALCFAVATRRIRPQALVHLSAFLLGSAAGVVFLTAQACGRTSWLGWTQRAQIVVLSAWFVAVGWSVVRSRSRPAKIPS